MAETVGSLADKIIISELKIFHTSEQLQRKDVQETHRALCQERLKVLCRQRDDLKDELTSLYEGIRRGDVQPKIYRQFKMYNDPRFRIKK